MEFNLLSTQNWSRTFNVWIEDIQVTFQPVVELERVLIRGGFLRKVRGLSRVSAVLVALLFTLHCTSPRLAPRAKGGSPQAGTGFQAEGYTESGASSWYGSEEDGFGGLPTASGEIFDPEKLTCAHRTLPLGSLVEVENLENGRKAILRVNDRGPFARGRILDVSRRGARDLGFQGQGVASIKLRLIHPDGSPAPLETEEEASFTVQVAALKDPGNIERLSKLLEEAFGPVDLQEARQRDGQSVKRVRVGSYATLADARKAAEEIAKRLGDRGVEPFILRRR